MHDLRFVKPFSFMEATASRHKRSVSDPAQRKIKDVNVIKATPPLKSNMEASVEKKQKRSPKTEVQDSLRKEVLQLQKGLHDQVVARRAYENALDYKSLFFDSTSENPVPKHAEDLIKEITVLELEVVYLEKYLLSLYREQFGQKILSSPSTGEKSKLSSTKQYVMLSEDFGYNMSSKKENPVIQNAYSPSTSSSNTNLAEEYTVCGAQKLLNSSVHRSHSSISHQSISSLQASCPKGKLAEAMDAYHSLPLSMLERLENATSVSTSLGEHLHTDLSTHVGNTPNLLSEEMIKCVSAIYCKLAETPSVNHDISYSPMSYSSSVGEYSPEGLRETWRHSDNPFNIGEGFQEFSGPYCVPFKEVHWIRSDAKKLQGVDQMLRKLRLLISRLEAVDLRKMKHEEKLAFWINVHNALVMHAFLVYGIPKNNLKRFSLLLKAAYNVGGSTTSIDMIQSSILGCRMSRPGHWTRFLSPLKMKLKSKNERRASAIEHPEPRLHFALCLGSHSDPPVRIYTPKQVFQELEVAKEEYIQTSASATIQKENKIVLPKLVDYFLKDLNLCPSGYFEMIEPLMTDPLRRKMQKLHRGNFLKSVEWLPHNFTFRYLLSRELSDLTWCACSF